MAAPVNTNVRSHVTAALAATMSQQDVNVANNLADSAHIQAMLAKGQATPDSIRAAKGV